MALDAGDRLELHELAARYANVIDRRDWDALDTVFTDDAVYELIGFGRLDRRIVGRADIHEFFLTSPHPVTHHVTNVEVDDGGDNVRMFSKILGVLPDASAGSADYDDVVVRTNAGWRIASRQVRLRRPPPPSPPASETGGPAAV